MNTITKVCLVGMFAMNLNGCLSLSNGNSAESKNIDEAISNIDVLKNKGKRKYAIVDIPFSNKTPYSKSQDNIEWLKTKKVSLNINSKTGILPIKEVLKQLTSEGVNISTTVPIDSYSYNGYPIAKGTDAYTALQILTEAVGLDFKVINNGVSRFVQIQEMGTTEYSLVVPDVKVAMEVVSGKSEGDNSTSSGSDSESLANSTSVDSKVVYVNEFWQTLQEELEKKLTILVPEQGAVTLNSPVLPTALTSSQEFGYPIPTEAKSFSGYKEVKVGKVSINSVTGNITVSAPKNIRDRVVAYLNKIDKAINTRIQANVRVVSVIRSESETAGIDIAGLIDVGSDYGLMLGNDTLGNLVITDPTKGFNVSASNSLTNSLMGISKNDGTFSAFIDYMQSQGSTRSLSEVTTSVRSGRTVTVSRTTNEPRINSSSQNSTTDGGTTTGGTTNSITNTETGVTTTITPVYDQKRGVVHSLVNVKLVLDAGETVQAEPLSTGSEIEIIERTLKNTDVIDLQTETLSKDGELIIAGGFTTQKVKESESGIKGIKDSFLGGLFGKARRDIEYIDYYIVVETRVVPFNRM